MKKLFNRTSLTILLVLAGGMNFINGQSDTLLPKVYSFKAVKLGGETETKEIKLTLRDSLNTVNILIFSIIGSGELSVEIYDPRGDRQGNFSLSCQSNPEILKKIKSDKISLKEIDESDGKAMGNLNRTVKNPARGFWIAKIRSIGAVGSVSIQLGEQRIKEGLPFVYTIN